MIERDVRRAVAATDTERIPHGGRLFGWAVHGLAVTSGRRSGARNQHQRDSYHRDEVPSARPNTGCCSTIRAVTGPVPGRVAIMDHPEHGDEHLLPRHEHLLRSTLTVYPGA